MQEQGREKKKGNKTAACRKIWINKITFKICIVKQGIIIGWIREFEAKKKQAGFQLQCLKWPFYPRVCNKEYLSIIGS